MLASKPGFSNKSYTKFALNLSFKQLHSSRFGKASSINEKYRYISVWANINTSSSRTVNGHPKRAPQVDLEVSQVWQTLQQLHSANAHAASFSVLRYMSLR